MAPQSLTSTAVAGDDNRAAFGFLGTGPAIDSGGTCDPLGTGNCANIWHAYVATTYDGGAHWSTIDTTPNKAVQKGVVCTQGTLCAAGRNLLDFTDFTVDSQGRGLFGYADGVGATGNNTFDGQSGGALPAIARQSGGQRLFSFFDTLEPHAPAAPQALSDNRVTGGILVAWRTPDNGGSTITGYNIYRGTTSGGENSVTPVGHVTGETSNEFLDTTVTASGNYFYHITAVNASGESAFCNEPGVVVVGSGGSPCAKPYLSVDGAGGAGTVPSDPTMGELTIQGVNIGEPFTSCTDNSLTFVMKVQTLDPSGTGTTVLPANSEWQVIFNVMDNSATPTSHKIFVSVDTFAPNTPATPAISYGRVDPCTAGCSTLSTNICTAGGSTMATCPAISSTQAPDGTITIKLNVGTALAFVAPGAPGTGPAFTWDGSNAGTALTAIQGNTYLFAGVGAGFLETVQATAATGAYSRVGNAACHSSVPIAGLTATPMTGKAPLSVNFDASTSREAAGACPTEVINSYTLDFGDGSPPVTQSTAMFSHTYLGNGDYPARLTVKDNFGRVSTNPAQVVISVASTFNKAVSHKVHALAGPFDIDLPLTGVPGNECRSGGANNDYTIIYTFDRDLFSVGSATVSHGVGGGTGSVSSQTFGPNANQYTVNITNVSNAQHLSVTLNDVHDAAGAVLNNSIARVDILLGDVNASGRVDSTDVFQVRQQTLQSANSSNFRTDVDTSGRIDSTDVFITRQQTLTSLP